MVQSLPSWLRVYCDVTVSVSNGFPSPLSVATPFLLLSSLLIRLLLMTVDELWRQLHAYIMARVDWLISELSSVMLLVMRQVLQLQGIIGHFGNRV